jgi:hypothetical protein
MGTLPNQDKIIFLSQKSASNAFFASLADRQAKRVETPLHRCNAQIKLLETAAAHGDFKAWQGALPVVLDLAKEAGMNPSEHLELRVRLKKLELDLLLSGQKRAELKAKNLEKQGLEAQMGSDAASAKDFLMKAQKLSQLAQQIEAQILEKTA